jgi:hypothetical protein
MCCGGAGCATLGDALKTDDVSALELWLLPGAGSEAPAPPHGEEPAVIAACRANASRCLHRLLAAGFDPAVVGSNGFSVRVGGGGWLLVPVAPSPWYACM